MDHTGKLYDLRPQDTKPSLNNFRKMEVPKLQGLLETALQKQIEVVKDEEVTHYDSKYEISLLKELEVTLSDLQR